MNFAATPDVLNLPMDARSVQSTLGRPVRAGGIMPYYGSKCTEVLLMNGPSLAPNEKMFAESDADAREDCHCTD